MSKLERQPVVMLRPQQLPLQAEILGGVRGPVDSECNFLAFLKLAGAQGVLEVDFWEDAWLLHICAGLVPLPLPQLGLLLLLDRLERDYRLLV